jgi:alpha-ketoglutarate-dependent taurine dioxygenase
MSYLSKHLHPISNTTTLFGKIVTNINLSQSNLSSNPSLCKAITSALYQHGLLIFKHQSHLTPSDDVSFCKLFTHQSDDQSVSYTGGAATQHRLPTHPEVALIGSYNINNYYGLTAKSEGVYNNWSETQRAWHCDGLADTVPPPDITLMRCISTPNAGGETLFASSVKAATMLPTSELEEEFGIHPENVLVKYKLFDEYTIAQEGTHLLSANGSKGSSDLGWDVNIADGTLVSLVIHEKMSKQRSMVGSYHVSSVVCSATGKTLDFERANAYLAKAWKPGLSEENIYSHQWEVGDVAAWSNRLVIHTATSTKSYQGQERMHIRVRMRSREEDGIVAWRKNRQLGNTVN